MITRVMVFYLPLITIMVIIGDSGARELRPSYHGLEYQTLAPTERSPPDMKTFFGGSSSPRNSNSSNVPFPRGMNSNETSWWTAGVGGGGGRGGGHVRHVLLVTSVVCGVAGAALFIASGLIFFIKRQQKKRASRNIVVSSNNVNTASKVDTTDNALALTVTNHK